MPALAAAALLVFIFSFTSFGVILLLGGPRFATLEVEIYYQTISLFNLPLAAVLAVLQLACTLVLTIAYTRLSARLSRPLDEVVDYAYANSGGQPTAEDVAVEVEPEEADGDAEVDDQ